MAIAKENKQEKPMDFEGIYRSFKNNLESLEVFLRNLVPVVKKQDRLSAKKVNKILKQAYGIIKVAKDKGNRLESKRKIIEELSDEQIHQIKEIFAILPLLTTSQGELLYRSSFVMLLSYFDFLISDLIRYYYRKYPEFLSSKALPFTLKELIDLGSVNDAKEYIINREADSLLYESLDRQKNFFKDILKVDLKHQIVNWGRLNEAVERRNIIVHNNCKINRRYLVNADLSLILGTTKELKEGSEINITEPYFKSVFEEICVAGVVLIQVCWRKWEKDDLSGSDGNLILDIYNELLKENWTCAERLGKFSKECEVKEQASRLILDVNYCQSLKWQDKNEELAEQLNNFDVSALSPQFVLAFYALKSDRDGFYKNIEDAVIGSDGLPREAFTDWPLFREMRKDTDYTARVDSAFLKKQERDRS
ncbi:MAG: hypothetical protein WC369_01695 [Dehalococcoidales bacterium]|jgi:hypothetical protein